jgi:hypothetical protein
VAGGASNSACNFDDRGMYGGLDWSDLTLGFGSGSSTSLPRSNPGVAEPSRCGSGGGSPAGRRRRRPRTIPASARLAGRRSGARRGGDADSMLLLPYRPIVASLPPDNAAAYAPVDGNGPPRTRHRFVSAHHPLHGGFELRCQKAVGSPHRSLVLPPADRLCSRNSQSFAPKTATCGRRRVKAQSRGLRPRSITVKRSLTSWFVVSCCPLLSPRFRRVAAPARPTRL